MNILVTGGLGYIGSHVVVRLLEQNHHVTIVDNLSNSDISVLRSIEEITGKSPDFLNLSLHHSTFAVDLATKTSKRFDAVIHFAAAKSVGESVKNPIFYYKNNVIGMINLLEACDLIEIPKFIFSSSCSIYGEVDGVVTESMNPKRAKSPYANTKIIGEQILQSYEDKMTVINLRYFNPIGCHPSIRIGDLSKTPSNLVPVLCEAAIGIRSEIEVFGTDYETRDGSCIRDYIDVNDLAEAHIAGLNCKESDTFNIGTGTGLTVLELIHEFEAANEITINKRLSPRRDGDISMIWALTYKSNISLNWEAKTSIKQSLQNELKWAKRKYQK